MAEKISVIVPIYNIKEYLQRCVESILAQTYENIEVLLVDDGSTDGSQELVDQLARKDSRIRVFHKENGGSSSARNLAIKQATGKYLSFIDSDDYIEPDMLERLYDAIQRTGMQIAQGSREEIDEQGNVLPDICIPPEQEVVQSSHAFMKQLLLHKGDCSFCTKLTEAGLMQEGFPEGALNEDFHVLVKILPQIEGIVCIPKRTYHVFYRTGSNTRVNDPHAFSRVYGDNVENAKMVMDIVKEHYPDLCEIGKRFGYYQRMDYLLHIPIVKMKRGNSQYTGIVRDIRKSRGEILANSYLTLKEKLYLMLFSLAPLGIRKVHRILRKGNR